MKQAQLMIGTFWANAITVGLLLFQAPSETDERLLFHGGIGPRSSSFAQEHYVRALASPNKI